MTIQLQPRNAAPVTAQTYAEITEFYAQQMQLLDSGHTDEWAATFTQDGVFAANAHPEPARTRAVIAAGAAQAAADFAAKGIQRRHWLGMIAASDLPDGTVNARCYALVIVTPKGGKPTIGASTTCDDVLVRDDDGSFKVQLREVFRDDLA